MSSEVCSQAHERDSQQEHERRRVAGEQGWFTHGRGDPKFISRAESNDESKITPGQSPFFSLLGRLESRLRQMHETRHGVDHQDCEALCTNATIERPESFCVAYLFILSTPHLRSLISSHFTESRPKQALDQSPGQARGEICVRRV